jgi:hypothetical protein
MMILKRRSTEPTLHFMTICFKVTYDCYNKINLNWFQKSSSRILQEVLMKAGHLA